MNDEDAHDAHGARVENAGFRDATAAERARDGEPSPPFRGWCHSIEDDEWRAAWAAYRDGARTIRGLSRKAGIGFAMSKTCIEHGFPSAGLPAFRERLALWERQREQARQAELEADRAAAHEQGRTEASRWRAFSQRHEALVRQVEGLLVAFGQRLAAAVPAATFVRHRRVRKTVLVKGADGIERPQTVVEDQAYVDALAVAKAKALWASTVASMPGTMKLLLGPVALAPAPESAPREFTPEQLEQLARGELPEGVTERDVGLALLTATSMTTEKEP